MEHVPVPGSPTNMNDKTIAIPRTIWMLWFQGLADAPFVVKKCVDSWVRENPTWNVVVLDRNNLGDYVSLALPDEKLQALSLNLQSDLIRLQILSDHGGVWADTTAFCMKPLDEWIDDYTESGFFAFHRPGRDRMLSTWFIASAKGSPMVSRLKDRMLSLFAENTFNVTGKLQRNLSYYLGKVLNRSEATTEYWFLPIFTKILRICPYYVVHYLCKRLVDSDPECQSIWNRMKKFDAVPLHSICRYGLLSPVSDALKHEIDEGGVPVYKLTWKYDENAASPSSALHYLVQSRGGPRRGD